MNMNSKVIVITGASSGLGLASACELASRGAQVILVCRDAARGAEALLQVRRAGSSAPILKLADLSSQESVRALAADLRASVPRIDVLINNAGAIFAQRELTAEGIEKTLAVNYLAPFLLSQQCLQSLLAAPAGRIVNVVSGLHGASTDVLKNLQSEANYGFLRAYRISKFALVCFTHELARRLRATRVTVNCVEPGPTRTRFGDNMTGAARLFPLIMKKLPFFRSPADAAGAIVHLAASAEVEGLTGTYFVRLKASRSKPVTRDERLAQELWNWSSQHTGLQSEE